MGFKGWLEGFADRHSLDNARPAPPEAELLRLDQAIAAVLGWRPKASFRPDRGAAANSGGLVSVPGTPDKKKATQMVAGQKFSGDGRTGRSIPAADGSSRRRSKDST